MFSNFRHRALHFHSLGPLMCRLDLYRQIMPQLREEASASPGVRARQPGRLVNGLSGHPPILLCSPYGLRSLHTSYGPDLVRKRHTHRGTMSNDTIIPKKRKLRGELTRSHPVRGHRGALPLPAEWGTLPPGSAFWPTRALPPCLLETPLPQARALALVLGLLTRQARGSGHCAELSRRDLLRPEDVRGHIGLCPAPPTSACTSVTELPTASWGLSCLLPKNPGALLPAAPRRPYSI